MQTQPLGQSPLISTRLAYGCMRITKTWDLKAITPDVEAEGRRIVRHAIDAGYILFDHADIYAHGMSEKVFGDVLRESPHLRTRMLIATKCGIRFPGQPNPDSPHRFDFSRDHILRSCDASLRRLGTDVIDLYQLHRPDLLMNPLEVAGAFLQLHQQGKVRFFGVSNFSPSFLAALQAHLPFPLIVNQVEIHLGRLDCFYDGTLDQCLEKSITPLAWSPLGGGFLGDGGSVRDNHPRREHLLKLQAIVDDIARKLSVSRTVLSLSWLLKHPAGIIPIVGSANPAHISDAVHADSLDLSREDWYRLLVAARGEPLP